MFLLSIIYMAFRFSPLNIFSRFSPYNIYFARTKNIFKHNNKYLCMQVTIVMFLDLLSPWCYTDFYALNDAVEVYNDIQDSIRSVLDGFNVCIIAYGHTGSGKTYTMVYIYYTILYRPMCILIFAFS